jgi:hypothetical protein
MSDMTAVSLFDALAREDLAAASSAAPQVRRQLLARFAEQLVADQLAELHRLGEYEREFASTPGRDPAHELEVRRTVWSLYADWADEADLVLSRARSSAAAGGAVAPAADRLDQAIGRVRARLSVTPEQTARAIEDARQGRVIPAEELRDELRARLRA